VPYIPIGDSSNFFWRNRLESDVITKQIIVIAERLNIKLPEPSI